MSTPPRQLLEFPPKKMEHEIHRLKRFLTRIASTTEIVGLGDLDDVFANPTGMAERELRARMIIAQKGLDGEEYP